MEEVHGRYRRLGVFHSPCEPSGCAPSLGWKRTAALSAPIWLAFILLLFTVPIDGPSDLDLAVSQMVQRMDADWFYTLMWLLSVAGTVPYIFAAVSIIAVVAFLAGRRLEGLFVLAAPVAEVLDALVKVLVGRERPSGPAVHVYVDTILPSFPSGHVVYFTFFYGFLCYLAFPYIPRRMLAWVLVVLTVLLALTVGLSRIYLGAHWLTDVIGGYLFGSGVLLVYIQVYATAQRHLATQRS